MLHFESEQGYSWSLTQESAAGGSQIKREGKTGQETTSELEGSTVRVKHCCGELVVKWGCLSG